MSFAFLGLGMLPSRELQLEVGARGHSGALSVVSSLALPRGEWSTVVCFIGPSSMSLEVSGSPVSSKDLPPVIGAALTCAGSTLWEGPTRIGSAQTPAAVALCNLWVAPGGPPAVSLPAGSSLSPGADQAAAAAVVAANYAVSRSASLGPSTIMGVCAAVMTAMRSSVRSRLAQQLWAGGFVPHALRVAQAHAGVDGAARAALVRAATAVSIAASASDIAGASRVVTSLFEIVAAPSIVLFRALLCGHTGAAHKFHVADDSVVAGEAVRALQTLACCAEFTASAVESLRSRLLLLSAFARNVLAAGTKPGSFGGDAEVVQLTGGVAALSVLGGAVSDVAPGDRVEKVEGGDGGVMVGEGDDGAALVALDSDPLAEPTTMAYAAMRPPAVRTVSSTSSATWTRAVVDDFGVMLSDILRLKEADVCAHTSDDAAARDRVLTVVALLQAHAALAANAMGAQLCDAVAAGVMLRTLLERCAGAPGGPSSLVLANQLFRLASISTRIAHLPPPDARAGGAAEPSVAPHGTRAHTGEYRDIKAHPPVRRSASGELLGPIKIYCGHDRKPEDGVACAHPGYGCIRESHFSCCGARGFGSTCDATSAGGHIGQWRAVSAQPHTRWSAAGVVMGEIAKYCASASHPEEGSACTHAAHHRVDYDHWSCCGGRDYHERCGAAAGIALAGQAGQGHTGEFRDSDGAIAPRHMRYGATGRGAPLGQIGSYCSVGDEGAACAHGGHSDLFKCAHWSCCGARALEFNCPLAAVAGRASGAAAVAAAGASVEVPAIYYCLSTSAPASGASDAPSAPERLESVEVIHASVRSAPRVWAACLAAARAVVTEAASAAAIACIVGWGDARVIETAMAQSTDDLVAISRGMHALATAAGSNSAMLVRLNMSIGEALKRLPAGVPALARAAVLAVENVAASVEAAVSAASAAATATAAAGAAAPPPSQSQSLAFVGWTFEFACGGDVAPDVARAVSAAARVLAADGLGVYALDVCALAACVARGPAIASSGVCAALRDFSGALGALIAKLDEPDDKKPTTTMAVKSRRLQALVAAAVAIDAALGAPADGYGLVARMRSLRELAAAFACGGTPARISSALFASELATAQTRRVGGRGTPCEEMDGPDGRAVVRTQSRWRCR